MRASELITRLQKVKAHGANKWMACCPAHKDASPSLAITETPNGKILLKCFTGCSAAEIVQSLGLRLEDLFPDAYEESPMAFAKREMADRQRKQSELEKARIFLGILTTHLKNGKTVAPSDINRARRYKKMLIEAGMINES